MGHPKKRNSSKQSKGKQLIDAEEIRELARSLVEESNAKFLEIEDPLVCYAHQLKMHWQQDVKLFSSRLIKGYEVLLEQINSEN